jgi:AcrR family transcriptional regulator
MTEGSTKERIAAAALRILEDEGSAAVSMRRVAAEAGVTPMATYRHFPNRAVLLETVADAAFAEVAKTWGTRTASVWFADRFAGLAEDYLDFALGRPNLYTFLIIERREGNRQYPEGFRPGDGSPLFGQVVETVEQGVREGVLRPGDPLEITLALTMAPVGLIALYLGGRIGMPESEFRALVHRTVDRVLAGVRA